MSQPQLLTDLREPPPTPAFITPDLHYTFEVALNTARRFNQGRVRGRAEAARFQQDLDALTARLDDRPHLTPSDLELLRRACTATLAAVEMSLRLDQPITRTQLEFALSRVHAWAARGHQPSMVA